MGFTISGSICRRSARMRWGRRGGYRAGAVRGTGSAGLDFLPGPGIACEGPVRSILLISRRPFRRDSNACGGFRFPNFGSAGTNSAGGEVWCEPVITRHAPDLRTCWRMRCGADYRGSGAAHRSAALPYEVAGLGAEWVAWSGLPMVFAVWAGRRGGAGAEVGGALPGFLRLGPWPYG